MLTFRSDELGQPTGPAEERTAKEGKNRGLLLTLSGFLLLAVGLVFGQTVRSGFVNFDDGLYVYENAHVLHGLSPREIVWAFTHLHAGYWIPLCWLSFMADNQFFGPGASGYHLTNVLLHAATTVLLFLVLRRMSGRSWPSATVAALFAVHPLHVESVAWVTERKDLLSGLCFVLALGAYDRYVRGPSSRGRYAAVVLFFVLGLMAKPMLVTLPVVLLLLDYWPLGRFSGGADSNPTPPRCNGAEADGNGPSRFSVPLDLIREKIPLFALAAVFCLVTAATEGKEASSNSLAFPWRVANALVSYVAYLDQLFCPLNLAAFYPHPEANLPLWKVAAAAAVLAGISAAAFISWRRYPYLLMGWLWYGVTLLPVIGLMQVGGQAMADRFTYLPQIGLYLALVWGAADVCRCWPYRRWLCGLTPVLLLVASMACAWRQTSFWRDSETLWNHTLACTSRNTVAHNILACAFASRGQFDAAILQFRRALEIKPDYALAHQNLGNTLNRLSRFDEALSHFRAAARLQPDSAQLRAGIGTVLARLGRCDEALAEYAKALEIEPGFAMGHNNMGNILLDLGRQDEALAHYRQAAKINPNFAMAHYNLAKLLVGRGDLDEALWHYQQLVRIDPNSSLAHDGLGAALSRMSRFGESLARCRQLLEVNPRDTAARCNMGAAWAECGQFEKALACYRRAVELQPDSVPAQVKLAWLRATCPLASLRDGREAIEHALQASQLCQDAQAQVLETLAAAYAEAGWFPEAVATANKAVELAERQHDRASAERLRAQLALFQAGKPFHQEPPPALSR